MEPLNQKEFSAALPTDDVGALSELAMDLRWSWNHAADELWERLDPALWKLTHHPHVLLQTVSRETLASALADPEFRGLLRRLIELKRTSATSPAWFQRSHPDAALDRVAYFCMEFMLTEALPIYSGGLGNVAGDQLKAASDLGVPVVGVGLLYQHGYFRQLIDRDGAQQALYPYNDPSQMPVTLVREPSGDPLRLELSLPGGSVWIRAWRARVGRLDLYLLDTNDAANAPIHRGITGELYGGDAELRLKQEIVLGIGGWRVLVALGIAPDVCHLNEGHAAFALLERARTFMVDNTQPFQVALTATRAGNLFTTHTAVGAGFDRFSPELVERYLSRYAEEELGISCLDLLALGRQNHADPDEPFNMAYLAMRGSSGANGVSELHGQVSRKLFSPLFEHWPIDEVPVGSVTNGVHMPTWDSAAADALWTEACGKGCWRDPATNVQAALHRVPDAALWALRNTSRRGLVDFANECADQQLATLGAGPEAVARHRTRLVPNVLTLGMARRFATYKRPNLLLHDPERLLAILNNRERPAQLILAGKAHPADIAGQELIQAWTRFIARSDDIPVVFLVDYDMAIAKRLVQGADVWISTPRRPWEASGTSGMKVLVNGGLNLAELDGWWAQAFSPEVGWALGDGEDHGDDPARDAADAEELYRALETLVIPEFYARSDEEVPRAWLARIRGSMSTLTPRFAASRTVREYTEQHYLPAAARFRERATDKGAAARTMVDWRNSVSSQWAAVRFGGMSVGTEPGRLFFTVEVQLHDLCPDTVVVDLYANGVGDGTPVRLPMTRGRDLAAGNYEYHAVVDACRPASDYTARITANYGDFQVPGELKWIVWQQ